jgi:tetratricopeptide (TPR) repeat protein
MKSLRSTGLLTCVFSISTLSAATVNDCATLRHHGKLAEAKTCYTSLLDTSNPYVRAEGLWGLERFQDANDQFKLAVAQQPNDANVRVRWGRLFLERFNKAEADKLFHEALQIDEKNAAAYLGLALKESDGFSPKAVEYAGKAIALDPKLVEAQELLAYLALEDNDVDKATKEADKAIALSGEALDALAIRATIELLDDKPATAWSDRIFKINPVYGEAYATAGHFFVINRRYTEGIKLYRKALELNPRLWAARADLGVNLMRWGQDGEARQQLEQCYSNGYRSAEVANSLTLLDSYKNFVTFETNNTILKLHKKEAAVLRPYFESEMKRAIATYEKKYQMKLKGPVQVEVYPDHEDFAVRTMGMPGLGALGVTFGTVVAMDSPSGRPPGTFHWASTMWHELSHVYVLTATNHRVPRWFTEGLAVYEETATEPDWGDRLDPHVIEAIKAKKLLPVAKLDRGFVRPEYPNQVVISYYQAGQICAFIAEKWGYGKLLDMIHSFAALKTTPEVVQKDLGVAPEEFDKQFLAWLDTHTKTQVEHYAEWKKGVEEIIKALGAKNYDEVIAKGNAIRDWFPDYVEDHSVYEALATAYEAKDNSTAALAQLEKYSSVGGRNSASVKKLATLEEAAGHKDKAIAALKRLNFIYPQDEELHRRLGDLLLAQNDVDGGIREFQVLVAMKPIDQAAAHYQLARALNMGKRNDEARDQVLLSLEAAPGYKPAQKLLLDLSK